MISDASATVTVIDVTWTGSTPRTAAAACDQPRRQIESLPHEPVSDRFIVTSLFANSALAHDHVITRSFKIV